MTMKSGFHNSINADRLYNAEDMNRPYKDIVSNGVFPNPSTQLQVFASSGMTVSVNPGGGLFGNGWGYNDSNLILIIESAEVMLTRIDAIIVKRDDSDAVRATTIEVKKGTPASTPIAPTMTHDDHVDEYCLATIKIEPETLEIPQSIIVDTRPDTNVCGWVTGLIEQVDTSTLFTQWQTAYENQFEQFTKEFNDWWASVRDILKNDETAAAEILRLNEEKADKKTVSVILTAANWTENTSDHYFYQTAEIPTMKISDLVIVSGDPSTIDEFGKSEVVCVTQNEGSLIFKAKTAGEVKVNIINMGGII